MGVFQNNLMGAAAAASAGGGDFYTHQIANSVRNSAAQDGTLKFTAGTPTSGTTFTMSYWVKRYDNGTDGGATNIFVTGTGGGTYIFIGFGANIFDINFTGGIYGDTRLQTNALYRDTSAWYHHVLRFDSTQAATTNRLRLYVNGVEPTYSSQTIQAQIDQDEDWDFINESGIVQAFGGLSGKGHGTEGANLQMAEIVFNDGQSYGPDSYGETKNGVWIPKDPSGLTFGNNGYYLKFESSSDLGNDSSGNNNDFTAANLATHDQMLDSPTFSSTDGNGGNFCTIGGLEKNTGGFTFSEGNLKYAVSTNNRGFIFSQGVPESGKYYWEVRATLFGGSEDQLFIGVCQPDKMRGNLTAGRGGGEVSGAGGYTFDQYNGAAWLDGVKESNDSIGTSRSAPQTFGFAIDRDNNTMKWTYDGSTYSSTYTIPSSGVLAPYIGSGGGSNTASGVFNFGADSTFAGLVTAGGNADGNGYGNFSLAVPSGYVALCSGNLPTADAVDPAETDDDFPQKLFNTLLYTGTGSSNALTGVGFQPDWTWIKERGGTNPHKLTDSTRGVTKCLEIDNTSAEATDSNGLTAFGSDGFTVGSDAVYNNSSDTYASWNWRLNGGTEVANSTGGIASTVQVDPSGGFSLVKYSGTGSASTVGHGLSSAPTWIFAKSYATTTSWVIYTTAMGGGYYMSIDAGGQGADSSMWNNTNSTSSVFSVGSASSSNGGSMLAYCWANVEGYIKSGQYEGNGNADGTFVYTGFRPAFIICKSIDSATSWQLFDDKRIGFNVDNNSFLVDTDAVEATTDMIDILSNGFKCRISTDPNIAETYIYLAIAKNPFQYATAR